MTEKIISMAEKADDAAFQSPEQTLEISLNDIGKYGAFKNGKKLLVLCLDESEGNYSISFNQAGMKMSECVSLCEVAKIIFLEQMGYISP